MQKRGDGGGIVPQPGTENTAVDGSHRSRGSRLARRIPPHLDRQPARQSVVEAIDIYRFRDVRVHAGGKAALLLAFQSIGGYRNDRRTALAPFSFACSYTSHQCVAVHPGHMDIREHRRVVTLCPCRQSLRAVVRRVGRKAQEFELPTSTSRLTGWSSTTRSEERRV